MATTRAVDMDKVMAIVGEIWPDAGFLGSTFLNRIRDAVASGKDLDAVMVPPKQEANEFDLMATVMLVFAATSFVADVLVIYGELREALGREPTTGELRASAETNGTLNSTDIQLRERAEFVFEAVARA
jgi:hypothetical protein